MEAISAEIIKGCKSGNRESQRDLYFLTIPYIKTVLSRYCDDLEDAKDTIQSTYLKVFEKIDQYDHERGSFLQWLTKIVINEYFLLLRKKRKTLSLEDVCYEIKSIEFDWSAFTISEISYVLNLIQPKHSTLLKLYFFDQLNYEELAQMFQLKESSVRGNLTRAKQAFLLEWKKFDLNHTQKCIS